MFKRKKVKMDMADGLDMLQRIVTINETFIGEFGNSVKDWPVEVVLDYANKLNEGAK